MIDLICFSVSSIEISSLVYTQNPTLTEYVFNFENTTEH